MREKGQDWDWTPGKREIEELAGWPGRYDTVYDPCISQDGEKIAAIVKTGDDEWSVCVNGHTWDAGFEKIWNLRFLPDNRLMALVSDTAMWTVAVDGTAWDNWYEFVWSPVFGKDSPHITVAAQTGLRYFAVTEDTPWENDFNALTSLTVSRDGATTAAVVQHGSFPEADIDKFQEGYFTAALNGHAWDSSFVNAWELDLSEDGRHLAAEVRTSIYNYTIAVDGRTWDREFSCVWRPKFHPKDNSVTAPVKVPGGWTIAQNAEPIWHGRYVQLWHHMYSPDGSRIAAIGAPEYGKWTIVENDRPWTTRFKELVTDAVYNPSGESIACVGKSDGKWYVAVNDLVWDTPYDMAWQPVFSPDGRHVAALVEKKGKYTIAIDGRLLDMEFAAAWHPVFSPDGCMLLVKGVLPKNMGGQYCRYVLKVDNIRE